MSDPDYLWNKEGSDPEVESLEKSLSGLKYDRPAPNLEPANALFTSAIAGRRRSTPLSMATASSTPASAAA